MNADEISPRLWMGARIVSHLPQHHGFDAVVLAAREYQPSGNMMAQVAPGAEIIRAPLVDWELGDGDAEKVERAAERVAELVGAGKRALVTCYMGQNRSGVIVARAMQRLLPALTADEVIWHIREKRKSLGQPLGNEWFIEYIRTCAATRAA
jgi:hypothetical protein